eukprot:XP_011674081.1 PREDICTED: uncharacterized protein LOC105443003 [Strongylocentrotus purpuratus]
MASAMALQSQQSAFHSLNSADRMRSSSQRELNNREIYADGAKYNEFEGFDDHEVSPLKSLSVSARTSASQPNLRVQDSVQGKLYSKKSHYRHSGSHQAEDNHYVNEPAYEPINRDDKEEYFPPPSPSDMPDDNFYMPLQHNDDQSSVSHVNNLGLENKGNANFFPCDDTAAPELPKRDYQNPTIEVRELLVRLWL